VTTLTRSHLSTLSRCRRKFFYTYNLELEAGSSGGVSGEGTLLHVGLAAAYKANKDGSTDAKPMGYHAMDALIDTGTYEYHGKQYPLGISKDTEDGREAIGRLYDVFDYYMENQYANSFQDGWAVVDVEKDFSYEFAPGITIEGTIDLVMRKGSLYSVWDHKSVSNIKLALAYLKLDSQAYIYEIMANHVFKLLYPDARGEVEMVWNFLKRDRPPGFGSRILRKNKDGSIAKNNASTNPEDYLRQHRFHHNEAELFSAEREFRNLAIEADQRLRNDIDTEDTYTTRTSIKNGGEACMNSCSFFERCAAELVGHRSPVFVPALIAGDTD